MDYNFFRVHRLVSESMPGRQSKHPRIDFPAAKIRTENPDIYPLKNNRWANETR